jgi:hypothetical protein
MMRIFFSCQKTDICSYLNTLDSLEETINRNRDLFYINYQNAIQSYYKEMKS